MTVRKSVMLMAVFLVSFIFKNQVHSATIILSDFDGTIVENDQNRNGSFDTPYIIYKITKRTFAHQAEIAGPDQIAITHNDFVRIHDHLSGQKNPGSVNRVFTLDDGSKIIPGHYETRYPETFDYFMKGSPLGEFKKAEVSSEGTFKGKAWELMREVLSTPEGARSFAILTARGHENYDWMKFWAYLKKQSYIQNLPLPQHMFSVNRSDFDHFGSPGDNATRKKNVLVQVLKQLAKTRLDKADLVLNPDGSGMGYYHTLVYWEDHPENLSAAVEALTHLVQTQKFPVKVVIGNVGLDSWVKETRRPRWYVITSTGSFRTATELEVRGDLPHLRGIYDYKTKVSDEPSILSEKTPVDKTPKKSKKEEAPQEVISSNQCSKLLLGGI